MHTHINKYKTLLNRSNPPVKKGLVLKIMTTGHVNNFSLADEFAPVRNRHPTVGSDALLHHPVHHLGAHLCV